MAKVNILRRWAILLVLALMLCIPVSASSERLAVERQVYTYLTDHLGLNSAAACGILANIEEESAFQPTVVGDQGTSYGLCQWHNERYATLQSYCLARGLDYRTVDGQMAYLNFELSSTYSTLMTALRTVENSPDGAYRAAYLWCIQFERPADMETKAVSRGNTAKYKYWNRYNSLAILQEEVPQETLSLEQVYEIVQRQEVTIPLPPEEPESREKRYVAERLELMVYQPRHLPPVEAPEQESAIVKYLMIPLIAVTAAAMVWFLLKPRRKRAGKFLRPRTTAR